MRINQLDTRQHCARLLSRLLWYTSIISMTGCYSCPKSFDAPPPTEWTPRGCRIIAPENEVNQRVGRWRNIHADAANSDEVEVALHPMFELGWIAVPSMLDATGPVFDKEGHLYMTPLFPKENLVLVSVDHEHGKRRWTIGGTGAPVGAGSPMILDDPLRPGEEMVYTGLYNRALAVQTDGKIVWDVPTGLSSDPAEMTSTFGINYIPQHDALVALTADGHLYALDRGTGRQLLSEPYSLPGEPSPVLPRPGHLTDEKLAAATALLENFMKLPQGVDLETIVQILLGQGIEVANFFSVDSNTGSLWIAATAPDGDDGQADGVSSYGAIYRLDLVRAEEQWSIQQSCYASFEGGSASTPALRADGSRAYVADSSGKVLAIDRACKTIWEVDTQEQVFGSIAVSSDNGELYAASSEGIVQILDLGASARIGWKSDVDVYDPGPKQRNMNVQLVSIAANGLGFQGGAGVQPEGARAPFPLKTGMGILDRATGKVRYFSDGPDESVAVISTGPDGVMYIAASPFRRAFVRASRPMMTRTLTGGIHQWRPKRHDLTARDAICAAAGRVTNAHQTKTECPDSAAADLAYATRLIKQASKNLDTSLLSGDIPKDRRDSIVQRLESSKLAVGQQKLEVAIASLNETCKSF